MKALDKLKAHIAYVWRMEDAYGGGPYRNGRVSSYRWEEPHLFISRNAKGPIKMRIRFYSAVLQNPEHKDLAHGQRESLYFH